MLLFSFIFEQIHGLYKVKVRILKNRLPKKICIISNYKSLNVIEFCKHKSYEK
jgi:hypothetical protein